MLLGYPHTKDKDQITTVWSPRLVFSFNYIFRNATPYIPLWCEHRYLDTIYTEYGVAVTLLFPVLTVYNNFTIKSRDLVRVVTPEELQS